MSYGNVADIADAGAWPIIALNCSGLFCSCMVCHGELAKLKPLPSHLTIFYLMISVGGALGGAFVAILAPRLFNGNYELPIGMSATAVIIVSVLYHDPACRLHRIRGRVAWLVMMCLTAAMISTLAYGAATLIGESRVMARNFYGTLRTAEDGDGEDLSRSLYHGGTLHGAQYLASDRRRWPTSYYGERTGIGSAILSNRTDLPQRVGVIGLGAGTLAAYGRPNDFYRIYEINGLVLQLARSEFSFLADSRATVEVTIGDARLSLEREQPQGFDVLAVDAFSGDSIPVHLLTRQAFELYFRHLKPGGILAVHVSNRYLDLTPVVKLAADHYSMAARLIDSDEDTDKGVGEATWILVTDRPEVFKRSEFGDATNEIQLKSTIRPWTDDYSSVFAIMK